MWVVLCLFDDAVNGEEKKQVAEAPVALPAPFVFAPGKPDFPPITTLLSETHPRLSAFITERSWLLFWLFMLDTVWLQDEPTTWLQSAS
jgi:hypothetical protein